MTAFLNVHYWLGNFYQENPTLCQTVELNYSSDRSIIIARRTFGFASSYAKAAAYYRKAANTGFNTKARFQVIVVLFFSSV